MIHSSTYRKICRTVNQAEKEQAMLQVLQTSFLQHLTPKLIKIQQNPPAVEMTYIEGTTPLPKDMVKHFLHQLGTTLRQLHHFRSYSAFGSFDANLEISQRFATFTDFLDMQIKKWTSWHRAQPGSYLHAYATWLRCELDQLRSYFNTAEPIFCHGDIDTKNLVLQERKLVGLIDWEYAGSYCLAWELRKLPRVLQYDWQWQQLLSSYDDSAKIDRHLLMSAIRCLDAADLLGHLRWCLVRGLHSQKEETMQQMYFHFNTKEVII
jgi:thiamine kinase-like enzyme